VQKELAEFDSKLNSKLVTIQDALPDEQHEQACYCAIASGRLPRAIVGRCPSDCASKQKKTNNNGGIVGRRCPKQLRNSFGTPCPGGIVGRRPEAIAQ
jgi:hypothetical protein